MTFLSFKLLHRLSPQALKPWVARLELSNLGSRLARGMFWSVFGAFASRGLALVASVIAARLLGKETFGGLGIIQTTINVIGTFGTLSMGITATKCVAEYRVSDPARAGRIIGITNLISWMGGVVMAALLVSFAPWISEKILSAPHLRTSLRVAGLLLLFFVVNDAQIGTLNGLEAFKKRARVQLLGGIASFPLTVLGVMFFGLAGAVAGLALSQGVLVLLNYREILRATAGTGIKTSLRGSLREIASLWQFSLPTFGGAMIYVTAIGAANAIIVRGPGGYSEMGLFSAADRWRTAILFIPSLLGGVALPMLSSLRAHSSLLQKYYKLLWTNVGLCFVLSVAVAAPVALLSPWIMASYGSAFSEGKMVLVMLTSVAVITSTFWILGQSLISEGRVWFLFCTNLIWASLLVGFSWALRDHGAKGFALSYLFAESVRLLVVLLETWRQQKKSALSQPVLSQPVPSTT